MNRLTRFLIAATAVFASPVVAAPFDGSAGIICAPIEIKSCGVNASCDSMRVEDIDAPQFLKISVADKKIVGTRPSGEQIDATIESVHHVANTMFLLGVQDHFGWSLAIGHDDGKMTLTLSDRRNGIVMFGACTRP